MSTSTRFGHMTELSTKGSKAVLEVDYGDLRCV